MKRTHKILLALMVLGFLSAFPNCCLVNATEPWLSHYPGTISWQMEMAHLDNFSIQLMNDPNLIGYILIYSGEDSCREEAQSRALRMKDYMVKVRGIPWDRVMWRDAGRYHGKGLNIFHLGVPRDKLAAIDFPYEPPVAGQVIAACKKSKSR